MGSPKIHSDNVWLVYRQLLQDLEAIKHTMENGDYVDAIERWEVEENLLDAEAGAEIFYPLIDGQSLSGGVDNPRQDGLVYMGGVNGGRGLGKFNFSLLIKVWLKYYQDMDLVNELNRMEKEENNFDIDEIIGVQFSDDEDNGREEVGIQFSEDEGEGIE